MKAQLTVRIPDELEQDLSALAQRLRLKRSDIVRLALEKFLAESRIGAEQRPYDKVKDLVGSIASEITDLGEKHREHLLAQFGVVHNASLSKAYERSAVNIRPTHHQ